VASTGRWIPLLLLALTISIFAGCGGSGTTNLQNPPAPASSSVSIAFQPAPAGSIALSSTTPLTAVVSNDPTNAGVDWSLLCSNGAACGTLVPLHTASGAPTTFSPPTVISGNNQTFTIEAFATADHSKNLVAPITVTGFAGNLKGTYVFQTRGVDLNGNNNSGGPFQLAGVIVLDGNGNITSGEQTRNGPLVTAANPNGPIVTVSDSIINGSYTIGPDGRGTITLNTADQNIGQLGVENFSLVFLSNSHELIATLDNPNLQTSGETSSGTLDLQTSTAAPLHGYAFAVSGIDINLSPMAVGGVLNISSPNTISSAGSIADQEDAVTGLFPNATVSGSVSNPDPLGSVTFNLTTAFTPTPIQFTGYTVDATHIALIESDNAFGSGFGMTAGQAIGQGAATGTFNSNSSFTGNYVFDLLGQDFSGLSTSFASVGQFTAGAGNLSGYDDEFAGGLLTEIGDSFTGTYTFDPAGTGRFDSNITFATSGSGPELIFYLTGNGNPPLILDADVNFLALGTGAAYPQAAPPLTLNGPYGLYLTQSSGGFESDGTAQVSVNGPAGTLSGFLDLNLSLPPTQSPQPDQPLSGTFGAIPGTGRSAGSLTNPLFHSAGTTPTTLTIDFYLIDSSHGYFIETDSLTSGFLTLGYFGARTPVCPNCP